MSSLGSHQVEHSFDSWKEAHSTSAQNYSTPSFVPHDATDIHVLTNSSVPVDQVMFVSATTLDPALCQPGSLDAQPKLLSSWWPLDTPTRGIRCSPHWNVFVVDGTTYGWTSAPASSDAPTSAAQH